MFSVKYVGTLSLVLIFIALTPLCLCAAGTITYVENFDNNVNRWWTGDVNDRKGEISNGKYKLRNKGNDTDWKVWADPISIDQNKDFEIDVSLKSLEDPKDSGYGLFWGLRDGENRAFNYFIISNKSYCYGFLENKKYNDIDGWTKSGVILPAPKQNLLTIKRSGDKTIRFINTFMVAESPVLPFFGNNIGIYVGAGISMEVDNLSVSISSDRVPDGVSVISEGSFKNSMTWNNPKDEEAFGGEVFNHSKLRTEKRVAGDYIYVCAELKTLNDPWADSAGIYITTDEGAMLKLERIWSVHGIKVRFSTFAQGKELGRRESVFPHKSHLIYRIKRDKDVFKGEVLADGKKTVEVGSLTWPKLSKNQVVGVTMSYDNNGTNAPASFKCDFKDFFAGQPQG